MQFRVHKRDETGNSRAYGRGIAFYVGEPCHDKCNDILFHVFCNLTSHRCECLPEFPVNVADSSICAPALSLGQTCEFDASCKFSDINSECSKADRRCRCSSNYMPKVNITHGASCIQSKGFYSIPDYQEIFPFIIIILLSLLLIILMFIAYKLCKKKKVSTKGQLINGNKIPDEIYFNQEKNVSPFILFNKEQSNYNSSSSVNSNLNKNIPIFAPPPLRCSSYTMLSPSATANYYLRRPSLSSLQSSLKSCSSFQSMSSLKKLNRMFSQQLNQSAYNNLSESILVNKNRNSQNTFTKPKKKSDELSNHLFNQSKIENYNFPPSRNSYKLCSHFQPQKLNLNLQEKKLKKTIRINEDKINKN